MNVNKRAVAAIGAVVLALLGIASLVAYANDADDRAFKGTELVSVIQVVNEVPAGTKAENLGSAVNVVKLPKAAVPDTALKTLDPVSGLVATATLVPGEVLVTDRFGTTAEVNGGEKVTVPKGMQEITIKLAAVRALDGKLAAGDHVGVAVSYDDVKRTNFAVNQVLVLSSTSGVADGETAGDVVVRLAVSSINAEKIVHASEFAHVYLTKQGEDADVDRKLVSEEDVLK
jgi:pilus assembly protein CpaB